MSYKYTYTLLLVALSLLLQNCHSKKKTIKESSPVSSSQKPSDQTTSSSVSFAKNILPILTEKCTPCHFPPDGKVEPLNTYADAKAHIRGIIERVKLPQDDVAYMPFKGKKPALTANEIKLLEEWRQNNFPQ